MKADAVKASTVIEHWTGPCLCEGGRVTFGEDDEGRTVIVHTAPACLDMARVRDAESATTFASRVHEAAAARERNRRELRKRLDPSTEKKP